jgi:cytochrome P450
MVWRADSMSTRRARFTATLSRELGDHSRPLFTLLRRVHPVIATRRFGVVTRADDVREVLADYVHFGVPAYNEKMAAISGPFILGLDDTPLYRHDHQALRAAIRREDSDGIAQRTLSTARDRLRMTDRQVDIVGQFADPTIDAVMSGYFGTPGPGTATQLRWARDIFADVFLNVTGARAVHDRALASAAEMRPHLDAQIAARRARLDAGHTVPEDVLTRLLQPSPADGGLHDIAIRHNLVGLIAGWIPTVSKAFACAIDELLHRPKQLERAQAAARAGDHATVGTYVFEALRFQPQTWALLRTCVADQTVAAGTRRATRMRAGTRVLVATQSAMFDRRSVPAPGTFRTDRPFESYLHFGHGLHMCFGLEINRIQLPAMAVALLEGPPLRRAPGAAGRMTYDGQYPASLTVTLNRTSL